MPGLNGGQNNPEVLLEQPTRILDTPGSPNVGIKPTQGRTGVISADITREYIASTPNQWYTNLVRILPFAIDDITQDFGYDLYTRILYDPIAYSAVTQLKGGIVESGLTFRSAVTDEDDTDYEDAAQITKSLEAAISSYPGSIDDWVWEVLDGLWQGNTLSELTYRLDVTAMSKGKQQFVFDRFSVKPMSSYGYAVDTYKKIIGIMGLVPGSGMSVQSGGTIIDPEKMPNLLPRDKFAIFTNRPRFEDPRGNSVFRPIYTPWQLKMQCLPEFAKWLKQFASPTMVGIMPPGAMTLPLVDSNGIPLSQPASAPTSPEESMLSALIQMANGTAAVFTNGSDIKPIEMRGQGAPFLTAFRFFNEEITTGILGQSMTMMSQNRGTQALGAVQADSQATLVRQAKRSLSQIIRRDLVRPWVLYNYGSKYMHLVPYPQLGETEEQDVAEELKSFSPVGYSLDPSQFVGVDKRLGMPARAPNWQEVQAETEARKTFLTQEAWSGGSALGQQMPQLGMGGGDVESKPGNGDQQAQQEEDQGKAQNARDLRWKEAVKLASRLKQETGISIDPNENVVQSIDRATEILLRR